MMSQKLLEGSIVHKNKGFWLLDSNQTRRPKLMAVASNMCIYILPFSTRIKAANVMQLLKIAVLY